MLVFLIGGIYESHFQMGSGAMMHIPKFNEDWSNHLKGNEGVHIRKHALIQPDGLITLITLIYFNKDRRLIMHRK
jgi:hypothetical protein